ncbi:hypothetical protein FKR81_26790 [Lentzea tibetensis]|uniref:Transcriptional regulator, AbiEi antitoxin, Type IV TA system n=1 Tax=Lentzea tibetensis TaxID=2591470 RepID=A0A563ENF6_9PSEU|nr:hypothetical protein [Lentzea tibetensis]TWP48902.1 hypothetical protein FKR81_26790 [Lentzea tibetensis]
MGDHFDECGLATTWQLRVNGVTKDFIEAQVAAQRWQRVTRGVYACFTGPLPRQTRLAAALLYAGPLSVLSHQTAAEEWGILRIDEDRPVHVTVPYTCSAVSCLPLVQLHRSRAFRYIGVGTDLLPRTTSVVTVVDLAVAETSPDEAMRSLIALANRAHVTVWQLLNQLAVRPPYRYRAVLKEAVGHFARGVTSALEYEYMSEVEMAHRLPAGQRQTPFAVDGRTLYEDVTYDNIGVRLTVRLDGKEHHSVRGVAFRDRRRDNAAELQGRARLVYGWHDVHSNPCEVAREVLTVLRREGWNGPVTTCSRCSGLVSD